MEHEVQKGDNLSTLSENEIHYSLQEYWPILYSANRDRIGNDPDLILPGLMLRIPCLDENGQPIPGQFDGSSSAAAGGHAHDHAAMVKEAEAKAKAEEAEESAAADVVEVSTGTDDATIDQQQAEIEAAAAEELAEEEKQRQAEEAAAELAAAQQAEEKARAEEKAAQEAAQEAAEKSDAEQKVAVVDNSDTSTVATSPMDREIRLLTADEFGLFVDKNTFNDGLAMKIVDAAMRHNSAIDNYQIVKINDWSAHIDPLLTNHAFDVGFPWLKPDCSATSNGRLCDGFLFSKPIMEVANLLFVKATSTDSEMTADTVEGKTLCRPLGYLTDDLDSGGRNWIADRKVILKQPYSSQDCFDMLLRDEVDAVAINEYNGRLTIESLNIDDQVSVLESTTLPSVELYALIHRDHPDANNLLTAVNNSVNQIRESGVYEEIISQNR